LNELTPLEQYKKDTIDRVNAYTKNIPLQKNLKNFLDEAGKANYGFGFLWLGVPIIQVPQDLQALQEIIWDTKPELIIETGIAWGGSLLYKASMLSLLEMCGVIKEGHVLGIDIEIRPHNKNAISEHPMSKKITMLEGSSIDKKIIKEVIEFAKGKRTMICLDSNHTHEHVLNELKAYAPLVSKGCYCIVCDTSIENWADDMISDRPWGKGNNPKTAVWEYLDYLENNNNQSENGEIFKFKIDKYIHNQIMITGSPDGYLKRV